MPPGRKVANPTVAGLVRRVQRLEERVARLEGVPPPKRTGRALPGDGRGRVIPEEPPLCPGCRLHVDPGPEKCPWCGFVFDAVPARLRPGGKDNSARVRGRKRP